MLKTFLMTLVLTLCLPLLAWSQSPEEQVLGAWKAAERDPELGVIHTFILTDKTLDQGMGKPDPISLALKDKKVVIQKAGSNRVIGFLDLVDKDTLIFSVPLSGDDVKFLRSTEAEVQAIRTEERKK